MKQQDNVYDFVGESLHTKVLYTVEMAHAIGQVKAKIATTYYQMFTKHLKTLGFQPTTFIPNQYTIFCNNEGNKIKVISQ